MFKSIISVFLLIILASCGSDSSPSGNAAKPPVTTGQQGLKNMVEISVNEAMVLLQNNAQYNQAHNIGDRYVRTQMYYQFPVDLDSCQVKVTTTFTVLGYDAANDELTSLQETNHDYSVGTCDATDPTERFLLVERNISQKTTMDNTQFNDIGEIHIYQGTLNAEVYLSVIIKGAVQGVSFDVEMLTSPKRPLWTEAEQIQTNVAGKPFLTSNSSGITHVDTSLLDTQGLSTVTIDYNN